MGPSSRANPFRAIAALGIIAGVFVALLGIRYLRAVEPLEFLAYDWLVRSQPPKPSTHPYIAIIAITESDIQDPSLQLDYPIWDDKLAALLERVLSARPAVVGLDILRDIPVPRNGMHAGTLESVFRTNENLIVTWKLSTPGKQHGVPPPTVLRDRSERIGYCDFPVDEQIGAVVRRALLFAGHQGNTVESLAMQLSLGFLRTKQIEPSPAPENENWVRLGEVTIPPLDPNYGSYVRADTRGYQTLIDFRSSSRYETYSYRDVMTNEFPVHQLANKVVLIGYGAESVQDVVSTPLRREHLGVVVQAHVVDQLIDAALSGKRPPLALAEWQETLWILAWCLVGGLASVRASSPKWFCLVVGIALPVLFLSVWALFRTGWWLPLVIPALGFFFSAGAVSAYQFYRERAQLRLVKETFERLVSAPVVDAMLSDPRKIVDAETGRLMCRKTTATVLFSDLKGSVSIAENMQSEEFMDWLNKYMEKMTDLVVVHNGLVSRFFGDAILAVYGVPNFRSREDEFTEDARAAVRCALAMERDLAWLNAAWIQKGLPPVKMRIGINTGELTAGALGSRRRMEYTVIGDTVNVAARLESFEKDTDDPEFKDRCCRILITEATQQRLGDQFRTKPFGKMELRNRKDPVSVHRVVGETNTNPKAT